MNQKSQYYVTFGLLLLTCSAFAAGDKSDQPKPTSPVNMPDGIIFEPMKWAISGMYTYYDQDEIFTRSTHDDPGFGKRERTVNMGSVTLRGGLFENFEISLMIPYWEKELLRRNAKGLTDDSSISGIGDIQIMARYQLLSQKKDAPLSLAVGAGLDLPTGDCDNENTFGTQPYMGPFLQLGTGSWNPKFNISATRFFGRTRMDANLQYTINTEGEHHLEKGDMFQYNLGYGYAFNKYITAGVEMNGFHQDRNTQMLSPTIVGEDVNSGGDMIFITPELSCRLDEIHTVFGLAVPVPIHTYMEGTQPTEVCRIVLKASVQF